MLGQSLLFKREDVPPDLAEFFEPAECGRCYVCELVAVFREVRRVLRDDGTLFLNLGDSYAGSNNTGGTASIQGSPKRIGAMNNHKRALSAGTKPKDLLMIPARVALALQADGWWLRSDIIWHKPNPMPESVTDRPTSAHEHVFLLAKSQTYYFDADAIAEKAVAPGVRCATPYTANAVGSTTTTPYNGNAKELRNIRNVWTIPTQPYSDAHFATFPPALVEPCIKAGTSEKGCCYECGAPWVRETSREDRPDAESRLPRNGIDRNRKVGGQYQKWLDENPVKTIGWSPSCDCPPHEPKPCTVLDCFGGAGTVGLVADRLKRNAVLVELNPTYADMARARIAQDAGMFGEVA